MELSLIPSSTLQLTRIRKAPHQPDIIALQETYMHNVRLQGYTTHAQTQRTATLVKKSLAAQKHEFEDIQTEHTLVEVLPERKTQKSLFVVNVSPPRNQLPDFDHLVHDIKKLTNGHQVVLVGDFNASHTAWGYQHTTRKGARVHDAAQHHGLTLCNDLPQNTRIGNSVSRDTNPDLTFTTGVTWAEWSVLPDTLGSDHHILQIDVAHIRRKTKKGMARLTEWKSFREDLDVDTTITDIDEWLRNILDTAERHTKNINLDADTPAVDGHLLHLWEARRGLLKRVESFCEGVNVAFRSAAAIGLPPASLVCASPVASGLSETARNSENQWEWKQDMRCG
ncbi:hypothetical protein HPB50_019062 [Hyalomma asiaticum]|uniref:Uncharacterized protein n=1 Tax=Hyalomma asiaticum TaxID=266040 RepID=A0ACB7TRH6_HYAAI|nr:hypothetical protein HPB50_019062 [Hyalomma asiaticum]